jgi:hypothetical protein
MQNFVSSWYDIKKGGTRHVYFGKGATPLYQIIKRAVYGD